MRKKSFRRKGAALLGILGVLFVSLVSLQARPLQFVEGTNQNYEVGDWVSYTNTRYMRSLAVGNRFVYFATTGGISRYDVFGNRWETPFTFSDGLPENDIYAVAFDFTSGSIFCATPSALCVRDPASRRWRNYQLKSIGVGNKAVRSIGFDSNNIYLMTYNHTLFQSSRDAFNFLEVSDQSVVSLKDSIDWFGEMAFKPIQLPTFLLTGSLLFYPDKYHPYFEDVNGRDFKVPFYQEDPWQTLWLASWGLGAAKADMRTQVLETLPFGLLENDVQAMALTGNDFWFGGVGGEAPMKGVTHWNRSTGQWEYFEGRFLAGFRSDDVMAIAPAGRTVWFGTLDGLTRYDQKKNDWNSYTLFNGLSSNRIYDLIADSGRVWVATDEGLDLVRLKRGRKDSLIVRHITKPSQKVPVYAIQKDGDLLWAATGYGVYVYNSSTGKGGYYYGADGPGNAPTTAVSVCGDEVWFGTRYGVEVYNKAKKKWLGPPERTLLSNLKSLSLCATPKAVWLGTTDGLYKFNRKRRYWKKFTQADGLINPRVQSIVVDGDYLWLGTPDGVTRFYWNAPYRID